jgi:hypothetical protein
MSDEYACPAQSTADLTDSVGDVHSLIDVIAQTMPGGRANLQSVYRLSPLQEGM